MARLLDVRLERDRDGHSVEPWPFADERVTVRTEGRLVQRTFTNAEDLRETLANAPWTELRYELRPRLN
jgi:hypothetical protein